MTVSFTGNWSDKG